MGFEKKGNQFDSKTKDKNYNGKNFFNNKADSYYEEVNWQYVIDGDEIRKKLMELYTAGHLKLKKGQENQN